MTNATLAGIREAVELERRRQPGRITAIERRRLAAVRKIVRRFELGDAEDVSCAAWLLHHGTGARDFFFAVALYAVASHLGDPDAIAMFPAAVDRYLLAVNRPQVFGTQTVRGPDGTMWLYQVATGNGDKLRAAYGVAPLQNLLAATAGKVLTLAETRSLLRLRRRRKRRELKGTRR